MPVDLIVPVIGESITEVLIGDWLKGKGEYAEKDESVVVIETEKATVELPAPVSGIVASVLKQKGDSAKIGEVIGTMEESERSQTKSKPAEVGAIQRDRQTGGEHTGSPLRPVGAAKPTASPRIMPAARRELDQRGIRPAEVKPTGPGGRLLKEDVVRHESNAPPRTESVVPIRRMETAPPSTSTAGSSGATEGREEEIVPMTPMRRTIAKRLVEAQQSAALLTTFNEIDMEAVMSLRREHQEEFQKKHGIKLGFMSFFVKAAVEALKAVPQVNAQVRGQDIVYQNFYDIGIAVGGGRGLVVPILRNAERLSFAEIETAIADFGKRAQENRLKLDELKGGTFTISNGGVYGSLLSTPIVNPPQSGILGLHAIQERPVVREKQIVIRPMMYVALTYDHRIVDGREAVTFLRRIKEDVENPARILLEV